VLTPLDQIMCPDVFRERVYACFFLFHTYYERGVSTSSMCEKDPTYLVPIPMATINWSNELLVLPQLSNERGKIRAMTTGTQ